MFSLGFVCWGCFICCSDFVLFVVFSCCFGFVVVLALFVLLFVSFGCCWLLLVWFVVSHQQEHPFVEQNVVVVVGVSCSSCVSFGVCLFLLCLVCVWGSFIVCGFVVVGVLFCSLSFCWFVCVVVFVLFVLLFLVCLLLLVVVGVICCIET